MVARERFLGAAGGTLDIFARGGAELELAGDILEGLEDRLERRNGGDVGIGHGMNLRRRKWGLRPRYPHIANVLLHCNNKYCGAAELFLDGPAEPPGPARAPRPGVRHPWCASLRGGKPRGTGRRVTVPNFFNAGFPASTC